MLSSVDTGGHSDRHYLGRYAGVKLGVGLVSGIVMGIGVWCKALLLLSSVACMEVDLIAWMPLYL